MAFGDSIRKWLWKGAGPRLDEMCGRGEKIENELAELKKLARRQGIQQESLIREISAKLDTLAAAGESQADAGRPDFLVELADSFFHLEAALALSGIGIGALEALDIVWKKLGDVCEDAGLEIIRRDGVPFDSRMHEALDRAPEGESTVVRGVAAPGFIHQGRVIRPARVMLSNNNQSVASESEEGNDE